MVNQSSAIPSFLLLLSMLGFMRGFAIFHENNNQGLRYEKETTSTADSCYSNIDTELSISDCG